MNESYVHSKEINHLLVANIIDISPCPSESLSSSRNKMPLVQNKGHFSPFFFLFYCYRLTWIYIKINFKTRLSWSHWIKMEKNKNFIPIAWLNEWRRLTLLVCTAIVIVACDLNEVFCCCCAVNNSERLKTLSFTSNNFYLTIKRFNLRIVPATVERCGVGCVQILSRHAVFGIWLHAIVRIKLTAIAVMCNLNTRTSHRQCAANTHADTHSIRNQQKLCNPLRQGDVCRFVCRSNLLGLRAKKKKKYWNKQVAKKREQ